MGLRGSVYGTRRENRFYISGRAQYSGESTVPDDSPPTHSPVSSVQLESLSLSFDTRFPEYLTITNAQKKDPLISSVRTYLTKAEGWQHLDANLRMEASRCVIMNDILYVWVLEQR